MKKGSYVLETLEVFLIVLVFIFYIHSLYFETNIVIAWRDIMS